MKKSFSSLHDVAIVKSFHHNTINKQAARGCLVGLLLSALAQVNLSDAALPMISPNDHQREGHISVGAADECFSPCLSAEPVMLFVDD